MTIKEIRATIIIDEADDMINNALSSLERGSFGVDTDGVYYMWYGSRNELVRFYDVEVINKEDDVIDLHKKNCKLCRRDE